MRCKYFFKNILSSSHLRMILNYHSTLLEYEAGEACICISFVFTSFRWQNLLRGQPEPIGQKLLYTGMDIEIFNNTSFAAIIKIIITACRECRLPNTWLSWIETLFKNEMIYSTPQRGHIYCGIQLLTNVKDKNFAVQAMLMISVSYYRANFHLQSGK